MKFEIAMMILKSILYIAIPTIFLIVGIICLIKLNPILFICGLLFLCLAVITPCLSRDLLFKYANEIQSEGEE